MATQKVRVVAAAEKEGSAGRGGSGGRRMG